MKRLGILLPIIFFASGIATLDAQQAPKADYPFRDITLGDDARIDDLLHRLSVEEKIHLMSDHPQIARFGLTFSGQVEGLHGLALGGPGEWGGKNKGWLPTTTFPQEHGLGNTWDPKLLISIGTLEGYEARYYYQSQTYERGGIVVRAPNADLSRDPRWGRTEESMGEDPFYVGTMVVAFAKGLQGPDPKHWLASSLMKHFLANENEDTRSSSSSDFDERLFREYYSVPFRMGFEEGGSRAVMAAYNSWNGTPMMIHPALRSVMIDEWHNDGLICTDGGALGLLISDHKSFADTEHGAAVAIKAGINHFLDTYEEATNKAVKDGLLTEADIDRSLHNLLRVYLRLGEMDPAGVDPYAGIGTEAGRIAPPWMQETSRELVRKATDESIVLLKNEGNALPLDKAKLKTIAVIGPYADKVALDWYSGTPAYMISPLDGIREAVGKNVTILFDKGTDEAKAAAVAKQADVAVVIVGNHPTCDAGWAKCPVPSNGKEAVDRKTIVLEQESLVKAVYAANPKTVEVLISSFPYAIVWSQEHVPAILHMTHNSQEQGHGLADALFGAYSPAGRLSQTWPTGDDQLLPLLDYNLLHGRTYLYDKHKPLYAFGYGLSYTTFSYEGIKVDSEKVSPNGEIGVTVRVKNTGGRVSDEVVQIYVQHLGSSVERPQLALTGFERVPIAPGQSADVRLRVKVRDLAYWDVASHSWKVEKEKIKLLAGGSSDNLPLNAIVEVDSADSFKP